MLEGVGRGKEAQKKKEDSLGRLVLARQGYRCGRLLGKGGFSRVYYVEGNFGACACKISENIKLLEREARVLELVEHPLFPKHFGFLQESGLGFLMSEYVPGCTLEEMLARRGHFTVEQTIRVGLALAGGIQYLHERPERFLFRDIKPSNIMIRQDGAVKLVDFGCVCSGEGRISSQAGTPDFAAPEQMGGDGGLTPACDVYGLGKTLEAMLAAGTDSFYGKKAALGHMPAGRNAAGGMAGRVKRKRLMRVLDACTRREAAERVPDMVQAGLALGRLAGI